MTVVRIEDLLPAERRLIEALIAHAEAQPEKATNSHKDASATNTDVLEVRDATTPPRAA